MIVVDVNVLAACVIAGDRTADVRELRDKDPEWIVPSFWRVEFESILWKYVRAGGMQMDKALDLLDASLDLFSANEDATRPDVVLRDALRWGITVCDAQYVSLARELGVFCVTEDRAVQRACPGIATSVRDFIRHDSGGARVRESKPVYRTRRGRGRSKVAG